MHHVTLTAEERFFYNDEFTSALAVAHAYLRSRDNDAHALRRELAFKFYTNDLLRCHIYGHTIVIGIHDGALYSGAKAGACELYTSQGKRHDADPLRGRIEQVLAYILAVNW
jgi:SOS response regulatory protein OraA/RecX